MLLLLLLHVYGIDIEAVVQAQYTTIVLHYYNIGPIGYVEKTTMMLLCRVENASIDSRRDRDLVVISGCHHLGDR